MSRFVTFVLYRLHLVLVGPRSAPPPPPPTRARETPRRGPAPAPAAAPTPSAAPPSASRPAPAATPPPTAPLSTGYLSEGRAGESCKFPRPRRRRRCVSARVGYPRLASRRAGAALAPPVAPGARAPTASLPPHCRPSPGRRLATPGDAPRSLPSRGALRTSGRAQGPAGARPLPRALRGDVSVPAALVPCTCVPLPARESVHLHARNHVSLPVLAGITCAGTPGTCGACPVSPCTRASDRVHISD